MEKLKITLIQPDIEWEDIRKNLEKYTKMISEVETTDVFVLPEMFTTGFSMAPKKLKEKMDGVSVEWMKNTARKKNAA
ncbi:MAG: nitrilase family protein, partial [Prolixibacteraceae bacterium]|nr:nitrilase family protein [Prolixibacteraceae bacterium]